MATKPPSDAPFGLEPNVAAGLAYLFTWVGGLVMLFGGGTNRFVKTAAAQSIVLWVGLFILETVLVTILHLWLLIPIFGLVMFAAWIYTSIMGFQGKEVTLPGISDWAKSIFGSQIG